MNEAKGKPLGSMSDKELLTHIRERFKRMVEADDDNRRAALLDMKFVNVPGEQWDTLMKRERGDRPCYEFNKLAITCKRVINDMRSNRPAGKVRGVEGGDKETAEIFEGLIRNVWNSSDGDTIIDQAAKYQVEGGLGAWRINTKYVCDDAFDQDIVVEAIQNPFCLYADPASKDILKRDAIDFILTDRISKKAYEKRWPKAETVDWEATEFDDEADWQDDETVRIVEYWYKEPHSKELWQLTDGKVIDAESDEAALIPPELIKRKRQNMGCRIRMCIASGDAILERADWVGANLPFVMVYGESVVIDGKNLWSGLVRPAKDAQRSYNIARTAIAETVAMAPQAKWWASVEQAKGHEGTWAEAHRKNFPFLLYNPDQKSPGSPQRMGAADVPIALIQESQLASEEIKAVTGIFDASLGIRSNETSGRAINARQQQGEIANFHFMDNMGKGIRRTWEILIDLIPKVYDTERELRILGADGAEDYVTVNQFVTDPANGKSIKVNDLSVGRYDVAITVGPSWATKRMEAAEVYTSMDQDGSLKAIAGDLMFKAMDLPYSEEIAERIRVMLPPQIQQQLTEGKQVPPEAQAMMAQVKQAMQMVEQQAQALQQAGAELQKEQAGVQQGKAEVQTALANLKAQQAQFEAEVAKQMAALTTKDAQLTSHEARLQVAEAQAGAQMEVETKESEFTQAIAAIQQAAQEFMQAAAVALQTLNQQAGEQAGLTAQLAHHAAMRPRIKMMKSRRVNGELIAEPIYEDMQEMASSAPSGQMMQ